MIKSNRYPSAKLSLSNLEFSVIQLFAVNRNFLPVAVAGILYNTSCNKLFVSLRVWR
jgi:hypothetical protein